LKKIKYTPKDGKSIYRGIDIGMPDINRMITLRPEQMYDVSDEMADYLVKTFRKEFAIIGPKRRAAKKEEKK
jgi:hypothetical protein